MTPSRFAGLSCLEGDFRSGPFASPPGQEQGASGRKADVASIARADRAHVPHVEGRSVSLRSSPLAESTAAFPRIVTSLPVAEDS
jgi:hypothetical protein